MNTLKCDSLIISSGSIRAWSDSTDVRGLGNHRSTCAACPDSWNIRSAGPTFVYSGHISATRFFNVEMEFVHSIRSSMAVAGMRGYSQTSLRVSGSKASAMEPRFVCRSFADSVTANAEHTVLRAMPSRREIAVIGTPSAQCSRRISAYCSTLILPSECLLNGSGGVNIQKSFNG